MQLWVFLFNSAASLSSLCGPAVVEEGGPWRHNEQIPDRQLVDDAT